jgi:hypothetical protein
MPFDENVLLCERNKGNFSLELVARFVEHRPVKYIIRITKPEGDTADYVSSLEGFKNVGELLIALRSFAEEKLYPTDTEELRKVLTAENIKSFAKLKKSGKFIK